MSEIRYDWDYLEGSYELAGSDDNGHIDVLSMESTKSTESTGSTESTEGHDESDMGEISSCNKITKISNDCNYITTTTTSFPSLNCPSKSYVLPSTTDNPRWLGHDVIPGVSTLEFTNRSENEIDTNPKRVQVDLNYPMHSLNNPLLNFYHTSSMIPSISTTKIVSSKAIIFDPEIMPRIDTNRIITLENTKKI